MVRFSIVTINFNNLFGLQATFGSIKNQLFQNYEFSIVDGGSSDGSQEFIKKKKENHEIDYAIVEPDNGIFDAMNKGIDVVNGDYIIFMNSGDLFHDRLVLADLAAYITKRNFPAIIYGDTLVKYDKNNTKIVKPSTELKFGYGMPFTHQSMCIKSMVQKKYKFDLKYDIYSAYDLTHKLFNKGYKFVYYPRILSIFSLDGVSSSFNLKGYKEKYLIGKKYKNNNGIKFIMHVCNKILREGLKKIVPKMFKRKIQINK